MRPVRRVGTVLAASLLLWSTVACSTDRPGPAAGAAPPWEPAVRLTDQGATDRAWMGKCAALRRTVEAHRTAPLVFIGDSLTYEWTTIGAPVWNSTFGPDGALDLGIVGDTTQNVLWRLDQGELAGLHPRLAVLLIGTNDIPASWTADEIAKGVLAVAKAVRHRLPDTRLLLLSLLPRGDGSYGPAVTAVDAVLGRSARPGGVSYLDAGSALEAAGGPRNPDFYQADLLHIWATSYRLLADQLQPVVNRDLGVRTR
jgi:lysophospholipase L1-like esterase